MEDKKEIMFIYHGWIEIEHEGHLQAYLEGELDTLEYKKRLLAITKHLTTIAAEQFDLSAIDLSVMEGRTNGIITVHLSGDRNHFHSGVRDLLDWIKAHAPMSHGLIFCRSSEIERYYNKYWVLRLAKNEVQELVDTYLSPIDERIENVLS